MIAPDLARRGETICAAVEPVRRSSQCAAATSCSAAGTEAATARGSRRRSVPARDGCGRDADDRRRTAREHSPRGARHDARGVREPRGPNGARPGRGAARPRRGRIRQRRDVRIRGVPGRRGVGTYLHGPLLPRNPWLADLLLSWAAGACDGRRPRAPRAARDELERQAHAVAAAPCAAPRGRPAS